MTMTVFVSSPYTHQSPAVMEDRARAAGDACAWLARQGLLPMSPIAHWHLIAGRHLLPTNAAAWADWNRQWVRAADAVIYLHLHGWEDSQGMAMERTWAAGKPQAAIEPHMGGFRWVDAPEWLKAAQRRSPWLCGGAAGST
jgi:hypothetical protein